ncbi:hypothetical protein BGZ94_008412, partial [Podila epigama]
MEPHDYFEKDSILYTALSDSLETLNASAVAVSDRLLHQLEGDQVAPSSQKTSPISSMQDTDMDQHMCVAEPVSLAHADSVGSVDADCSMLVSGSDDGIVRLFFFGDDLWRPPSPPSPRLCGQASLISLAAPRCVLMMKPGRTRVSVGNRRQTWGTCALSVMERARSLEIAASDSIPQQSAEAQDRKPTVWMTVDEIYQKMIEWDMQPVSQGSTPKHTLNLALHMMATSDPPTVIID